MTEVELRFPDDKAPFVRRAFIREANRIQGNITAAEGMDLLDPDRPSEEQLRGMRTLTAWFRYQAGKLDEYVSEEERSRYVAKVHNSPTVKAEFPDGAIRDVPAVWSAEHKRHIPTKDAEWNYTKPIGRAVWLAIKRKEPKP